MKLSFTTLSCPGLSFEKVLDIAQEEGYEGIELRGIQDELDNTRLAPLQQGRLEATMADMTRRGLAFCCMDTSVNFHEPDRWPAYQQEAEGNIRLAHETGAPYIRVFGDRVLPGENHEAAYDRVARGLCLLGDLAGSQGVKVLLETHGEFASGRHARAIMQRANHPAVGVLWDVHHPYKYAGEALSYTLDAIRPWLFHVHLKDSKGPWATHRLTVPGRGDLPLKEAVNRLWLSGYDGWLSLEHELRWHPEIEPAREALHGYAQLVRQWI